MITGRVISFFPSVLWSPKKASIRFLDLIKKDRDDYFIYLPQSKKIYIEKNRLSKWRVDIFIDVLWGLGFGIVITLSLISFYYRKEENALVSSKSKLIATAIFIFFIADIFIYRRVGKGWWYRHKLELEKIKEDDEIWRTQTKPVLDELVKFEKKYSSHVPHKGT